MITKQIVQDTEAKMKKSVESAKREFSEVRTGRAQPSLIEGMHVDYFGTPTMVKQLANVTSPDPKTIIIQPWDPSVIAELEKMIMSSKLGLTPTNDGKTMRLSIPPLSEERREEMKKIVKDMAEKSKVSLRTIRRDANDRLKKIQSEKTASEDESFKAQDEIQKTTDKYIKEIDSLLDDKSKELMSFK